MFVKMTQKQAQHVKWLALYQGGIHVTLFSVVIEITSIAKNMLNLVYARYSLDLFLFFFCFVLHNYAEHCAQFCQGKNKPQHKNGTYDFIFCVCAFFSLFLDQETVLYHG